MVPFSFAGQEWRLTTGNALFWPRENALLVADLHLEKASFFARTGQMLPPYDSRETLGRIAAALRATGARRVFCLGDSFHDTGGLARLEPHAAGMLAALTRATDWVWIAGNHDGLSAGGGLSADARAGAKANGGETVEELALSGVTLRHAAQRGEAAPEISGHFHPKLTLTVRGRRITRPCAVRAETRLVLPAFGALTGGMAAADPAIRRALEPSDAADALVSAAGRMVCIPLWRSA